jgi:hypothetical protein
MFDKFVNGLSYKTMIMGFIALLVLLIGCMMYFMKDTIFPPKQVTFDPVVKTVDRGKDSGDYIPSKTFTGRKPGFVFKLGGKGQGYYKDNI